MGDTIKEFLLFISDNPLMLGLCIAIAVLFVILIIVLFAGGKKNKTENEEKLENTSQLFTATIESQNLQSVSELNKTIAPTDKSTQNIQNQNQVENLQPEGENLEETLEMDYNEEEAPINIDEALNLKKERELVPNIENTSITPKQSVETDIIPIPVELNKTKQEELNIDAKREEKPIIFKETKNEEMPDIKDFFNIPKKEEPVIPSSINDESKEIDETLDKLVSEINMIKTSQLELDDNKINAMFDELNQVKTKSINLDPLSNAEINYKIDNLINDLNSFKPNEVELPKQSVETGNTNIFDKVQKTGPISRDLINRKAPSLVDVNDDLDDIELPKLKTEDTSPLKILKGESFDLN